MNETRFDYPVYEEMTLNEFLASYHLSKSKIYNLIVAGNVYVNGIIEKGYHRLSPGDIVSIIVEESIDYAPMEGKLEILYEDDYFLIVNKPDGMIIHRESKEESGALCNLVAAYYEKKGYSLNVRFAHRLDKETTGVIVFCKDILCHSYMNYYISIHEIRREYRCLVQGKMKQSSGRINLPIGTDRHVNGKMVISSSGKEAITNYQMLYSYKGYSLVKVVLETGRTHQIRLHMSNAGNPILGDTMYGGQKHYISRVALHSYRISFLHPVTRNTLEVTAEMPMDMAKLMRADK